MRTISGHITDNTKLYDLGIELGVPPNRIDIIRTNNDRDITNAAFELLRYWQQMPEQLQDSQAQLKQKLKEALHEINIGRAVRDTFGL